MKDTIEENNRLRNEQLGNRRVDELTKREHFAAMALGGLLANIDYNIGSSISSSVGVFISSNSNRNFISCL